METAQTFRKPAHQIGFLLSCGYFNAAKHFFTPKDYQQSDIAYAAHRLSVQPDSFAVTFYQQFFFYPSKGILNMMWQVK